MNRATLLAIASVLTCGISSQLSAQPAQTVTIRAEIDAAAAVSTVHLVSDIADTERLQPEAGNARLLTTAVSWTPEQRRRSNPRLVVRFQNGDVQTIELRPTLARITVPIYQSTVESCWPNHLNSQRSPSHLQSLHNMAIAARMMSIQDSNERCKDAAGRRVSEIWIRDAYDLLGQGPYRLSQEAVAACRRFGCMQTALIDGHVERDLALSEGGYFQIATTAAGDRNWDVAVASIDTIIDPILQAETPQARAALERRLTLTGLRLDQLIQRRTEYRVLKARATTDSR